MYVSYYYCGKRREREDSAVDSLNCYYYRHYTMRVQQVFTTDRFTVCWRWIKIAHNYNVIGIFQRKYLSSR